MQIVVHKHAECKGRIPKRIITARHDQTSDFPMPSTSDGPMTIASARGGPLLWRSAITSRRPAWADDAVAVEALVGGSAGGS